MQKFKTLGELKKSLYRSVSVRSEMRANLLRKLAAGEPLFPGIIGFDDSVIPQIANAILSRHNFKQPSRRVMAAVEQSYAL